MDNYKYDIALSFAGEQREYAKQLANRLSDCDIKVFLDSWNIAESWGKDLTTYFSSVFPKETMFVVTLFSEEYIEKTWPRFEFEVMQSRQMSEEEFILPIIIDNTFPQNWPKTRGFIDAKDYSIDEIALIIREKIIKRKRNESNVEVKSIEASTRKLMTVIDADGSTEQVEVILAFEFKDTKKEFVIYTKNEIDGHGNTTVYISYIDRTSGNPVMNTVDDADWWRVKEVLWKLSQDDSTNGLSMPLKSFFDNDGNEIL